MSHPEELSGPLVRIRGIYPSLRPAERRVADYILANPAEVVMLSSMDLGKNSGTSDATVVKFSQRLGFRGYQELKIALACEAAKPMATFGEVEPGDDMASIRDKVLTSNIAALQDTREVLAPDSLERAVAAILSAKTICFYGVGASGLVALDAQQKFMRIGLVCHTYQDIHLQLTQTVLLGAGDVAFGFSHSGQTKETFEVLQLAKKNGATTIALTNNPLSALARLSDIVLLTSAREANFRSGAISSRLAQLSVVDVIFMAVAVRRYSHSVEFIGRTRAAIDSHRL